MKKDQLRTLALQKRDVIGIDERQIWSEEITKRLTALTEYKKAVHIMSYASFRSEVITDLFHDICWKEGKSLYLPKTDPIRKEMIFYPVLPDEPLVKGYQGIREPSGTECFCPDHKKTGEFVFMVVPGVAFDKEGNRIGYGGGYYDRYLERYGKYIDLTVMAAFCEQQVDSIPAEQCDRKLRKIVTEREIV